MNRFVHDDFYDSSCLKADRRNNTCAITSSILELKTFASSAGGNVIPDFVVKVSARIHDAPLLDFVTFVDTPGLGDPDEHRRDVASRIYDTLDTWLFLIVADAKMTDATGTPFSKQA